MTAPPTRRSRSPEPEAFDLVICAVRDTPRHPALRGTDIEARDYWVDGEPPTSGTQYEYLRASRLHQRRPDQPWNLEAVRAALCPRPTGSAGPAGDSIPAPTCRQPKPPPSLRRREHSSKAGRAWDLIASSPITRTKPTFAGRVRDEASWRSAKLIEQLPATWTEGNPYAGLAPMDEDRSAVFVGREERSTRASPRSSGLSTRRQPFPAFLLLTGPSGVGKSSLARAGLAARFNDKRRGAPAVAPAGSSGRPSWNRTPQSICCAGSPILGPVISRPPGRATTHRSRRRGRHGHGGYRDYRATPCARRR